MALKALGISAAAYNSHMNTDELRQIEGDAIDGNIKLLYVSPERLNNEHFHSFLSRLKIDFFAIDVDSAIIFTQMADQLAGHENIQLFHFAYRMRPART